MTTATSAEGDEARDSFPKLLAGLARERAHQPAYREKEYGIWQSCDWAPVAREVNLLAAGLAELGFCRGARVLGVAENRPKLYWSMAAAQSLGGVPVPVYQDSVTEELAYVVEHAGARYAVAENQEQIDKLREIQKSVPSLKTLIYDDPRGLRHYDGLLSYSGVQERGAKRLAASPQAVSDEIAKGRGGDDPSI